MSRRCWVCGRFASLVGFAGNVAWAHGSSYHRLTTAARSVLWSPR